MKVNWNLTRGLRAGAAALALGVLSAGAHAQYADSTGPNRLWGSPIVPSVPPASTPSDRSWTTYFLGQQKYVDGQPWWGYSYLVTIDPSDASIWVQEYYLGAPAMQGPWWTTPVPRKHFAPPAGVSEVVLLPGGGCGQSTTLSAFPLGYNVVSGAQPTSWQLKVGVLEGPACPPGGGGDASDGF